MSITLERFQKLRSGDVVLMKSGMVRTIQVGPADTGVRDDKPTACGVVFSILRRLWTGRIVTTYGWNDLRHKIVRVVGRNILSLNPLEYQRLVDSRFDVRAGIKREFREAREMKLRTGRTLCGIKFRGLPI